jgi:hypothetical protein
MRWAVGPGSDHTAQRRRHRRYGVVMTTFRDFVMISSAIETVST